VNFFEEFSLGISSYSDAVKLVHKHKLYPLMLICFLLFLIVLSICAYLIYLGNDSLISFVMERSWFKGFKSFFEGHDWIISIFKWSLIIASMFLFISFYKFVFLALASPMYAYVSEKGEEKLMGSEYPFKMGQFIKDILRGIRLAVRNLFRQLFLTLLLFLLSFIPVVGILFSIGIIILDSYYYGFAMFDYNCERQKMNVRDSLKWVRSHRGLAMGNGAVFYAAMILLPVIGVIFIAPLSAIAATIAFQKTNS